MRTIKKYAKNIRRLHLKYHRPYVLGNLVTIRKYINAWRTRLRVRTLTYRFYKKALKKYRRKTWKREPHNYHNYIRKVLWQLQKKRLRIRRLRRQLLITNLRHPNLPNPIRYYRFKHQDHKGCIVIIRATKNNFVITATNQKGEVLVSYNAGKVGAKGGKKSLNFTAEECSKRMANFLKSKQIGIITLIAKSRMKRRLKDAVKSLLVHDLKGRRSLTRIPVPHNGIRGKKLPRK